MKQVRLGVNIDHVATIRNARGGKHPCPIQAALLAQKAGADGITAHLREDRRHIKDHDISRLKAQIDLPLNFEMAATDEMINIALKTKPNAVCIVPEKRQEITTEGGLDVISCNDSLIKAINNFKKNNIRVSLFIDAEEKQIRKAAQIGADIIELHTGTYCENKSKTEFDKIAQGAKLADELGLECHGGHGLDFETATTIAKIPQIIELNIGHFLIGQSIFSGLEQAIIKMRQSIKRN